MWKGKLNVQFVLPENMPLVWVLLYVCSVQRGSFRYSRRPSCALIAKLANSNPQQEEGIVLLVKQESLWTLWHQPILIVETVHLENSVTQWGELQCVVFVTKVFLRPLRALRCVKNVMPGDIHHPQTKNKMGSSTVNIAQRVNMFQTHQVRCAICASPVNLLLQCKEAPWVRARAMFVKLEHINPNLAPRVVLPVRVVQ